MADSSGSPSSAASSVHQSDPEASQADSASASPAAVSTASTTPIPVSAVASVSAAESNISSSASSVSSVAASATPKMEAEGDGEAEGLVQTAVPANSNSNSKRKAKPSAADAGAAGAGGAPPVAVAVRWERKFALLSKFRDEFGHCEVPCKPRSELDAQFPGLGKWVSAMRQAYKAEQRRAAEGPDAKVRCTMRVSKEQQERLMKLGFVWDLPKHHWEKKFELLKKYKEEHGDCLVPPRLEDPKYKALPYWVTNQRQARRNMEALAKGAQPTTMHRILDEHIQKLTEIGFYWNPKAARQNVKSKAASRTPKEATDAADAETDAAAIASAKDTTTLAGESAAGGSVTASAVKKVTAAAAAVPATAVPAASSSPEAPDGVVVAKAKHPRSAVEEAPKKRQPPNTAQSAKPVTAPKPVQAL